MSNETPTEPAPEREPRQQWLFPYENPLPGRLGTEFFSTLPRAPGVYLMIGPRESILYVGKAKDLRARLASYKRARPGQVSRKVIRMIHLVDEIRWETCETEEAALLRENDLLRRHRPPFNVVNTRPDTYAMIGLRVSDGAARFRLTTAPAPEDGEELFGAFKGRGGTRYAYCALLRLLWASQNEEARFEYPSVLNGRKAPPCFAIPLRLGPGPARWRALLKRFLTGSSDAFLKILTAQLLENPNIPPFQYRCLQEDLERLAAFYESGPRRNRRLKRRFKLRHHLIAQDEIDDLLVRDRS